MYILINGEFVTTGTGKHSEESKGFWSCDGGVRYINHVTKNGHISRKRVQQEPSPTRLPFLTVVPQKHSAIDLNKVHTEALLQRCLFLSIHIFLPLK